MSYKFKQTNSLMSEVMTSFTTSSNPKGNSDLLQELQSYLNTLLVSRLVEEEVETSSKLYSISNYLDKLIKELQTQQRKIYADLNVIKKYNETHEDKKVYDTAQVKELIEIRLKLERLIDYKSKLTKILNNKDKEDQYFKFYNDLFEERYDLCDKLFDKCFDILKNTAGFSELFSKDNQNYNSLFSIKEIDLIYDYYHDASLYAFIKDYLPRIRNLSLIDQDIKDTREFVKYIKIASEHTEELIEYLRLKSRRDDSLENKKEEAEEKLREINSNILKSGLLNRSEKTSLITNIESYKSKIAENKRMEPRFVELENILTEAGLKPILDSYSVKGKGTTVEEKVAILIRMRLNRNYLDVSDVLEKMLDKNKELIVKKEKVSDVLDKYKERQLNTLDSKYKTVLDRSYEDLHYIQTLKGKVTDNSSPLLAAYIIKLLIDTQSLTTSEIRAMINVNEVYLQDNMNKCNEMIDNTAIEIQQTIEELLDVSEAARLNSGTSLAV